MIWRGKQIYKKNCCCDAITSGTLMSNDEIEKNINYIKKTSEKKLE
jgi:hypothetical protein